MTHALKPLPKNAATKLGIGALVVSLLWVAYLANGFLNHAWVIDAQGRIIANDFVNVWAAGHLAQLGQAAAAYDWVLHRAVENEALGYNFGTYFGWHYPPMFLFVATALASLPYLWAWAVWTLATLTLFCIVIRRIVGHWSGIFLAIAFPATMWNISVGQNGFFTAALMGGALIFLDARPKTSGMLLGLLAYKPHLGLLFPFILLAEKRWRVIIAATLTLFCAIAAATFAFGLASWEAFFHWMPIVSDAVLNKGRADFGKLQTVLGAVRWLGGSTTLASALQIIVAITALGLTWRVRRMPISNEIGKAMLALAAIISTPYLYIYDVVILAVPLAFMLRLSLREGTQPYENVLFISIVTCIFMFPFLNAPIGVVAYLLTGILILRRVGYERKILALRKQSE